MFLFDVTNPEHRFIIETARSWGVALSTFMGDSKMVPRMGPTGGQQGYDLIPGWTNQDRESALALAQYESDLCSGCRTPMSETMDPSNEFRFMTDPPMRCHRCTAVEQAQDQAQKLPSPGALHIPVYLKTENREPV